MGYVISRALKLLACIVCLFALTGCSSSEMANQTSGLMSIGMPFYGYPHEEGGVIVRSKAGEESVQIKDVLWRVGEEDVYGFVETVVTLNRSKGKILFEAKRKTFVGWRYPGSTGENAGRLGIRLRDDKKDSVVLLELEGSGVLGCGEEESLVKTFPVSEEVVQQVDMNNIRIEVLGTWAWNWHRC